MKRLLLLVPLFAGCVTQKVATVSEVECLRNEVRVLRQELKDAKSQKAYREFKRGRRITKPVDKRNDLPKGVTR